MAIIEPVKKDIQYPQTKKNYSSSLRLWHWANVIIISGSLLTVLLNSTILSGNTNARFIKSALQEKNVNVTIAQAKSVSHALNDKVWDIHKYFGFGLSAFLLFRIILEFFQKADEKFIPKLKSAYTQYQITKKNRESARHGLAVKSIYMVFYILLTIMVLTGLFLAFENQLAAFKSIRPKILAIHSFCMYLVLAFIAVHLAGVFLAERKDSKGIVSDMINGGKEQK